MSTLGYVALIVQMGLDVAYIVHCVRDIRRMKRARQFTRPAPDKP